MAQFVRWRHCTFIIKKKEIYKTLIQTLSLSEDNTFIYKRCVCRACTYRLKKLPIKRTHFKNTPVGLIYCLLLTRQTVWDYAAVLNKQISCFAKIPKSGMSKNVHVTLYRIDLLIYFE